MPYIRAKTPNHNPPKSAWDYHDRREQLDGYCSYCEGELPQPAENAGELAYKITRPIDEYVEHVGWSYQTANDVVGALLGLAHEFQRRFVDPYEDFKREQNGDVFKGVIKAMNKSAAREG